MADEEKKNDDQKKDDDKKQDADKYNTSHEGTWWVRQTGSQNYEGALPQTQCAIIDLGEWFYNHTDGKALVVTSIRDGEHPGDAPGKPCHMEGYKFDCNDWAGPQGLDGSYFEYFNDGTQSQLMQDFIAFGHSLGLGMAIEGSHLDVQTTGFEWTTGENYGGYNSPNGNKSVPGGGKGPAGGGPCGGGNAYMNNIKDLGEMLELMPSKKTYCEPMYPDLVYVQGNIPCSPIEDTVVNKSGQLKKDKDFGLMTSQTTRDLTGLDGNAFTGNKAMEQAQRAFDPTSAQLEVKVPNAGKPLNNNDSFPIDLKIEEIERHLPRVKQYQMPYDKKVGATKSIAAALLHVSDYAEKRIVRLENNMATIMRYLFATGSRIAINCQYWGGTDHRSWNLAA